MGRTKRRRMLKKKQTGPSVNNLNSDLTIIELNKWLKDNLWYNDTKLKIIDFPNTGRGVMTKKFVKPEDIIIEIPYKLMLTYTSLENSDNFKSFIMSCNERLLIYDLMSLYLLLELHLKESSSWKNYIKSLPVDFSAMWLCSEHELGYVSDEVSILAKNERNMFEESWLRVKRLLNSNYTCRHCDACVPHVLTRELYIWAYYIIHTRAVYVDPDRVLENSGDDLINHLDDEPCIALCPFLDMFNHTDNTDTQAYLSDISGTLNYYLITNSYFKKHEQIFISYGPYDNKRLITQYGFVLPNNEYDKVEFQLKDILTVLNIRARSKQLRFICKKRLDLDVFINNAGCSFNLTALLFVLTNDNYFIWSTKIFSSKFSNEELNGIYLLVRRLLENKLDYYKNELEKLSLYRLRFSRHFSLYLDYVQCRIEYVRVVISKVIPKFIL